MKKILSLLIFCLGFVFTTIAQDSTATETKEAPKQIDPVIVPEVPKKPEVQQQVQKTPIPEIPQVNHKELNLEAIELPHTLADVATMTPAIVRAYEAGQVASALQLVVKKYGYFETLVQLEQSPLYALYLYTGSRLLEQGIIFIKLAEQLQLEHRDYFSRSEFEYVSDLLKAMQVNS